MQKPARRLLSRVDENCGKHWQQVSSKLGSILKNMESFFLIRWKELGNGPALQFYNEAITIAPESQAARAAEEKVSQLRND